MSTLPKADRNWVPEVQEAYNVLKNKMEQACKELNIPMSRLQYAMLEEIEKENQNKHNYTSTQKGEKKPAGIVRRWLSSIFGNN